MQTTLNFKLDFTNEKLTPRTGVAIFREYLKLHRQKESTTVAELAKIIFVGFKSNSSKASSIFNAPMVFTL